MTGYWLGDPAKLIAGLLGGDGHGVKLGKDLAIDWVVDLGGTGLGWVVVGGGYRLGLA